ncbi:MAG: metallophosphoesterase [Thermoplasmatota archaeon]
MTAKDPAARAHSPDRERPLYQALVFLLVVSTIILTASAGIAAVYSLIFSPDTGIHWQFFAAVMGMSLYVLGVEFVAFVYHTRLMRALYILSSTLMGAFFYMFLTTIIGGPLLALGALLGLVHGTEWYLIGLRVFVAGGVIIPVLWGLVEGRFLLTKRVKVPLKGYRGKGFRIVLISDVHVGLLVAKHRLGRINRIIERERPDIIVSAGDLLDTNPRFLRYVTVHLKKLASLAPSYAVIGNHEFYHGFAESKGFLKELGFELLDNRSVVERGTGVTLMGVDDPSGFESYEAYRHKIEELSSGAPEDRPVILVNHQPLHFRKAAELGVGLMLSGHTHSGQMWPAGFVTKMIFKDGDRGMNRLGDSYLYVCIGTGSWGPPMRVGAPSEVVVLDIVEN